MKKGISLVALVITIIVLIILTAAVILTISNDGILDKAQNAANEKSKLEVYNAVQREVLNVQNEKRELVFGIDFANELKIRLDKKHPASNSIVEYNPSEDEIDIVQKQ
ncbi:MAG: hypothetical protein IKB12_08220 [Clostridia bacterium]|nr:hypothetical protein [Clostridia bacterium]